MTPYALPQNAANLLGADMTDNHEVKTVQSGPARPGEVTTLPDALLGHHTIIERREHGPFHCAPPYNKNIDTICHVTLFTLSDNRQVIVMSELADNPGSSVTNAADFLVPAIYEALGTRPLEDTVFVEHYHGQLAYRGEPTTWETFDRIVIEPDINGRPTPQGWESLYRSEDNADE